MEIQLLDERCFIPRYKKQVTDIHVAAYLLHPSNHTVIDACLTPETHFLTLLIRFFWKYGVDHLAALTQFFAFRAQRGDFNVDAPCWDCISDPVLFWQVGFLRSFLLILILHILICALTQVARNFTPELGNIAFRLAQTPANSVPSERAFSTLNLLLNELRNKLSNEKVDMIQYIYMNERVLARALKDEEKMQPQHMGLATDDMLVELEDGLIQVGELGVISNKRERERNEEEEENAARRQRTMAVVEIID